MTMEMAPIIVPDSRVGECSGCKKVKPLTKNDPRCKSCRDEDRDNAGKHIKLKAFQSAIVESYGEKIWGEYKAPWGEYSALGGAWNEKRFIERPSEFGIENIVMDLAEKKILDPKFLTKIIGDQIRRAKSAETELRDIKKIRRQVERSWMPGWKIRSYERQADGEDTDDDILEERQKQKRALPLPLLYAMFLRGEFFPGSDDVFVVFKSGSTSYFETERRKAARTWGNVVTSYETFPVQLSPRDLKYAEIDMYNILHPMLDACFGIENIRTFGENDAIRISSQSIALAAIAQYFSLAKNAFAKVQETHAIQLQNGRG